MSNPEVVEKVIAQATKLLIAAGCKYAILKPDGEVLGELEVRTQHKRVSTSHQYNFAQTGYLEKIRVMQIGDVVVFDSKDLPFECPPDSFRKVISGSGNRFFGNGNVVTSRNDTITEILRTG